VEKKTSEKKKVSVRRTSQMGRWSRIRRKGRKGRGKGRRGKLGVGRTRKEKEEEGGR